MAKIVMAKDICIGKTNIYRVEIAAILKEEQAALDAINQAGPEQSAADIASKRLALSDTMLNLAANYMIIHGITQSVLSQKNEEALNDARKALYKSVIYLETVVSGLIDAPYSDYEDKVAAIAVVSPADRYLLVRKMGLAINLLINAYGDNTKWKWTFVELEGRFAAVAKNIMNLRDVIVNSNFESEHYEPTVRHVKLIVKLLTQAADRYREKYELSTGGFDDFKLGINFLSALRRLHIALGDQNEAVTTKKKLDTWTHKLTADIEKQEKEEKENK